MRVVKSSLTTMMQMHERPATPSNSNITVIPHREPDFLGFTTDSHGQSSACVPVIDAC